MGVWFRFILIFIHLLAILSDVLAIEREFTISVEPGREECFYQTVKEGQVLDVEYQVIDGGHGDLDINFRIVSPTGRNLVSDFKKTDSAHRKAAHEPGDFQLCFDNSFSRISTKIIYFEMIVESEDENDDEEDEEEKNRQLGDGVTPEEELEAGLENIEDSMNRVKSNLNKVRHVQDQLRAFEARDRNIQEHNFSRVNLWSMGQIVIMLAVGLVQVIMVRSLFDDGSRVHRIWRKS